MFVQDRGVMRERRGSSVQAERKGRLGVRYQAAEGLERVEEAVSPREEVHVRVGARERGRVEASGRAALQHAGLVAGLVLQHYRDAGQGHRHDSAKIRVQVERVV